MATNYEVRYSTEQNEWLFWDDVNNQFADPQPTLATALAGENLIVLNSDAPGGFFFSGGAGSDVYNVQAGFAQNVLLSDPLHGQGSFNILRFDADVELVSAEIVDFPEIASSELQIVLKVSEAVSVTITVRSLDGMRFQVGGAVTPIYTAQELVQNFAVVANLPADAVFEDSAYSYDMSATADGTVAPVAVGTALVANDRNGDEVAYRLAADAPAGFMVSDQGQILFTGLATDLTETLYTFEVIATSLGADETLTDVRQLVSVRLVVERTFQGSSDVDVFDLSARQDNLIVEGGDGSDILTMGSGHDIVTGGLGNDKIDLSAGGSDRVEITVSLSGVLDDGGDTITGFTLGEDVLNFVPRAGEVATDTAQFLQAASGANGIGLDHDDMLIVTPNIGFDADGGMLITGLNFHFAFAALYGSGTKLSSTIVRLSFTTALTASEFLTAIGGVENFDGGSFAILDLTIGIPGLFGADGFLYEVGAPPQGSDAVFAPDENDYFVHLGSDGSVSSIDIGAPITATDGDGDAIVYSLSPTAPDFLEIDAFSGQLRYVGGVFDAPAGTEIPVLVVATSTGAGGSDVAVEHEVVVTFIPALEDAVFSEISPTRLLPIYTDGTQTPFALGAPVEATDVNGDPITYRYLGSIPAYEVDAVTGQIMFTAAPVTADKLGVLVDLEIGASSIGASGLMTEVFTTVTLIVSMAQKTDADMTRSAVESSLAFQEDPSFWDVSRVTSFEGSFDRNRHNLTDVDFSGWDVSDASNFHRMFYQSNSIDADFGGWDIGSMTTATEMFTGSEISVANLDATLRGWAKIDTASGETNIHMNVDLGLGAVAYSAATTLQYLSDTYSWLFSQSPTLDISAWAGSNVAAGDTYTNAVANVIHLHGLGGDDTIVGGEHSEFFYGGAGDDTLTGNGGADRFVYQYGNAGDDTITDFNAANGDVIDISHSLQGAPTRDNVSDYVSFAATTDGAGVTFSVHVDGASDANGVDYSFTVLGLDAANLDLAAMVDSGALDIV